MQSLLPPTLKPHRGGKILRGRRGSSTTSPIHMYISGAASICVNGTTWLSVFPNLKAIWSSLRFGSKDRYVKYIMPNSDDSVSWRSETWRNNWQQRPAIFLAMVAYRLDLSNHCQKNFSWSNLNKLNCLPVRLSSELEIKGSRLWSSRTSGRCAIRTPTWTIDRGLI